MRLKKKKGSRFDGAGGLLREERGVLPRGGRNESLSSKEGIGVVSEGGGKRGGLS